MDSTMKVWDVVNGQILYTVHGHEGPVCSVDFSRDGDYFCSGGTDQILMIWKSNVAGEGFIKDEKKKKRSYVKKGYNTTSNMRKSDNLKSNNLNKNNSNNNKSNIEFNSNIGDNVNSGNNFGDGYGTYNNGVSGNNFIGSQTGFQSLNVMVRTNQFENSSTTNFNNLPSELKVTFEKLISQMDMVGKTMQIMDQRLLKLENQVGVLYNRQRKGFIEPGPDENYDNNNYNNLNNENLISSQQNENYNIPNNEFNTGDYNNNNIENENENENYEKSDNLKDTMKYYQEKFNVKNIFNQNLDVNQEDNMNNNNLNSNSEDPKMSDNLSDKFNNKPHENMGMREKVPVEIFEDIGDHLEDFEKDIISSKNNEMNEENKTEENPIQSNEEEIKDTEEEKKEETSQ